MRKNLNLGSKKYAYNIVIDVLTTFVVIFMFCVFGLITFNFFTDLKTDLVDNDDGFMSDEAKEVVNNSYRTFPKWLDGALLTILILFWIVLLGLTFVVDSHPIIWGIVLFLLIFVIFVGATLSNTYHELTLDEDLNEEALQLPKTQWIMDRLPFVIAIIILSLLFAMMMKSRLV